MMRRKYKIAFLSGLVLATFVVVPARADKLVVFANGRTLRASEHRLEGEWTYLVLGKGGGEIGMPTRLIATVTEIADAGTTPLPLPNVQASAGGSTGSAATGRNSARPVSSAPRPPQPRPAGGARPPQNAQMGDQEKREAAAQARRDALARAASQANQRADANRRPPATTPEPPSGVELSGNTGGWPSLLDRNRQAPRSTPRENTESDR